MEWMILPLKRYADFKGRSRRKEYWMFTLGVSLVAIIALLFLAATLGLGGLDENGGGLAAILGGTGMIVLGILYLAIIIPSVAVQVRRFHDQDKSGWLVLLNFIPYIGALIVFVFMLLEGTRGPNRFGPDPKDPNGDLESVFS